MPSRDIQQFDIHSQEANSVTMSLKPYEGYKNKIYSLKNDESGPTVGIGVDFGAQTYDGLMELGVPKSTVDKIDKAGLFGIKGQEARNKVFEMEQNGLNQNLLSRGEIAHLSNVIIEDGVKFIIDDWGQADWDTRTNGEKIIALSFVHQYGETGAMRLNGMAQLKERRYDDLMNNFNDWQDQTTDTVNGVEVVGDTAASINKRYKSMMPLVPNQVALASGL